VEGGTGGGRAGWGGVPVPWGVKRRWEVRSMGDVGGTSILNSYHPEKQLVFLVLY